MDDSVSSVLSFIYMPALLQYLSVCLISDTESAFDTLFLIDLD